MKRNLLAFLVIMMFVQLSVAQTPIQVGEKYTLASEVLSEEREVWIGLPLYFDSSKTYPILYVMDAEYQFDITLAIVKELTANDKAPAHIVVGIPMVNGAQRLKDLTFTINEIGSDGIPNPEVAAFFKEEAIGGGEAFFRHLRDEVIPFVNVRYPTNGFEVLLGHSLSGYFGAYIMSKEQPFNAFQLYDPSIWYNEMETLEHLKKTLDPDIQVNVFIASAAGGREKQAYNLEAHERIHEFLVKRGVHSNLKVYEHEDHGTVRLAALIDGITQLYEGYSIGFIMAEDKITVADADQHYKAFSEKVNFEFQPPVDVYRWIGHANHFQNNWEEALKAFELSMARYSEDGRFCEEVSDSYYGIGEDEKGILYLEKALSLDPSNPTLLAKLKTRKENQ